MSIRQALMVAIEELEFDQLHCVVRQTGEPRKVDQAIQLLRAAVHEHDEMLEPPCDEYSNMREAAESLFADLHDTAAEEQDRARTNPRGDTK